MTTHSLAKSYFMKWKRMPPFSLWARPVRGLRNADGSIDDERYAHSDSSWALAHRPVCWQARRCAR